MFKNPNSVRSPSGLEWRLFKKLPFLALAGVFQFGFLWLLVSRWPWEGTAQQVKATVGRMEFVLIGGLTFYFSMLVAIFFGCVMVIIMKGPEYRADGIALEDSDRPGSDNLRQ